MKDSYNGRLSNTTVLAIYNPQTNYIVASFEVPEVMYVNFTDDTDE